MTTRRNSGGLRVRNSMLKDLNQFDRQLENTINTISTGRAEGLYPVTTFLIHVFFSSRTLFVHSFQLIWVRKETLLQ